MDKLKIDFPLVAFFTSLLYLNAYFFQVGVLGFYGYPNTSSSLSFSYILEAAVPALFFYLISFFFYFMSMSSLHRFKLLAYIIRGVPALFFIFWFINVYNFEAERGLLNALELGSIISLGVSFYGSMLGYSLTKNSFSLDYKHQILSMGVLLFIIVFSGSSLGRMTSFYLGGVYKVEGKTGTYFLKHYGDGVIISSCGDSGATYKIETDFSNMVIIKLRNDIERENVRACYIKARRKL